VGELDEAQALPQLSELEEAEPAVEVPEGEAEPLDVEPAAMGTDDVEYLESAPEVVPLPPEETEELEELTSVESEEEEEAQPEELVPIAALDFFSFGSASQQDYRRNRYQTEETGGARLVEVQSRAQVEEDEMGDWEELESLEEPDELEALEELDEAEGATEPAAAEGEIAELVSQGFIDVLSVDELVRSLRGDEEAIVYREGVFQVDETVFRHGPKTRDKDLQQLVDTVLSDSPDAESTGGAGPAGQLSERLEFVHGVADETPTTGTARSSYQATRRRISIGVSSDGLDYDEFRGGYKAGDTGVAKSLVNISHRMGALFAAILVQEGEVFHCGYAVGVSDQTRDMLAFHPKEPLYEQVIRPRMIGNIKYPPKQVAGLAEKMGDEDSSVLAGGLLFPIVYEDRPAYLFVGMRTVVPDLTKAVRLVESQR
jgi:hypothetical protein